MPKKIGGNINMNTDSIESIINVNSNNAVTLVPPPINGDLPLKVEIFNASQRVLWVRKRTASSDNIKSGLAVLPLTSETILNGSNLYDGEISAILESGVNADIKVTIL